MAKRRDPGQKEYNPLDDARGRLPIESDLIRAVVSDHPSAPANDERPQLTVITGAQGQSGAAPAVAPQPEPAGEPRQERPAGKQLKLEKLTAYNKFLTTPTEKLQLDRLAAHVSGALGMSVKPSQLIRACLVLMLRAENEIMRRAEVAEPVKRPSNTEAVALAEFDQMLAELLAQAFRDARAGKQRMG
jgi:hypothetical protein